MQAAQQDEAVCYFMLFGEFCICLPAFYYAFLMKTVMLMLLYYCNSPKSSTKKICPHSA